MGIYNLLQLFFPLCGNKNYRSFEKEEDIRLINLIIGSDSFLSLGEKIIKVPMQKYFSSFSVYRSQILLYECFLTFTVFLILAFLSIPTLTDYSSPLKTATTAWWQWAPISEEEWKIESNEEYF